MRNKPVLISRTEILGNKKSLTFCHSIFPLAFHFSVCPFADTEQSSHDITVFCTSCPCMLWEFVLVYFIFTLL